MLVQFAIHSKAIYGIIQLCAQYGQSRTTQGNASKSPGQYFGGAATSFFPVSVII